ncbi:MAG: DUF2914 domain-containing protein [Thermodesulfovibrionales bacterium]
MNKWMALIIVPYLIAFGLGAYAQMAESGFSIERFVIAGSVENIEPVDVKDTFPSTTEKVYCFIEARNIKEDTNITVVWSNNGKEVLKTSLPLKKGFRWRTYADKKLYGMKGEWKVDILNGAGNPVKSITFKVE